MTGLLYVFIIRYHVVGLFASQADMYCGEVSVYLIDASCETDILYALIFDYKIALNQRVSHPPRIRNYVSSY